MFKNAIKVAATALVVVAFAGWTPWPSVPAAAQAAAVKRTVLLQHDLSIPGYAAAQVAVELPAGAREGKHTHPGLLLGYVQEGVLTLEYEGKPTATYKPGDSFFVEAGKIHEGINSGTSPVKLLATVVVEKGKPLTSQVP